MREMVPSNMKTEQMERYLLRKREREREKKRCVDTRCSAKGSSIFVIIQPESI